MSADARRRIVYGIGPVRELLRSGRAVDRVYCGPSRQLEQLAAEARAAGVKVEARDRRALDELAGDGARHQGVVALTGPFPYVDTGDIVAVAAERGETALVVALDGIQDPHNLGAIVRSAYLLGAHGVVIPRDRSAAVTPVVTKSSAGATEHLAIAQVTNLARALGELKDAGLWIAAIAAADNATPIAELDATTPLCLVLGAEGKGIRPGVAKACDYHVEIPMHGPAVGSFNVSVAAAIALYAITSRR